MRRAENSGLSGPLASWCRCAPWRLRGAAEDGALALRAVPAHKLERARSLDDAGRLALRHWSRALDAPLKVPANRAYAERAIKAALAAFLNGGGW